MHNGRDIIFTPLKRAMTVATTVLCIRVRTHAPAILPIQLPVSGYLPTGHFRCIAAGGDRHGKWYRSTCACVCVYVCACASRERTEEFNTTNSLDIHFSAAVFNARIARAFSSRRTNDERTRHEQNGIFVSPRYYFLFATRHRTNLPFRWGWIQVRPRTRK